MRRKKILKEEKIENRKDIEDIEEKKEGKKWVPENFSELWKEYCAMFSNVKWVKHPEEGVKVLLPGGGEEVKG